MGRWARSEQCGVLGHRWRLNRENPGGGQYVNPVFNYECERCPAQGRSAGGGRIEVVDPAVRMSAILSSDDFPELVLEAIRRYGFVDADGGRVMLSDGTLIPSPTGQISGRLYTLGDCELRVSDAALRVAPGHQFPSPQMQEIGRSADPPLS